MKKSQELPVFDGHKNCRFLTATRNCPVFGWSQNCDYNLRHDVSPEKKRVEICISGWSGSYVVTLHRECYHSLISYVYSGTSEQWTLWDQCGLSPV